MTGPSSKRTPLEAALRYLGARRYGEPTDSIEYAIMKPDSQAGLILEPLTEPASVLEDWTPPERAQAVWRVVAEGIRHPHVSAIGQSRRRLALHAAFRLADEDIGETWGASLTDRFKQLRPLRIFGDATSIQPMEIAWKRGVERLAFHLQGRLDELRTPDDWAPYLQVKPQDAQSRTGSTVFREPSEGAQKLIVNFYNMTVLMKGRSPARRVAERLIMSQDDDGLEYYVSRAFSSPSGLEPRTYVPTHALWGCRAEQVDQSGMTLTQLWFPRPLRTGEQAYFISEMVYEDTRDDIRGWDNVEVDFHGIEPGVLRDGVLPVSGLTIRIRFDPDFLPKAVWWYAEQNEIERYAEPPEGSPRRLEIVAGDVVWTFKQRCQPRESYGIAYVWA